MRSQLLQLVAFLAAPSLLALSAVAAPPQMLHSHIPPAVRQFNLQPFGRLPDTNRLHIAINLPLRNDQALEKLIRDIYDTRSTNFHRYLTPEQFVERFGPSPENYQSVINFANANGLNVTSTHPAHQIMGIDASVADIERALHVRMMLYQHPTKPRTFYAPDVEPSLDLDTPVQAISGLDNYSRGDADLVIKTNAPHKPLVGSGKSGNLLGHDFPHAYAPGINNTGTGQVLGLVEKDGSGFVGAGGYYPGDLSKYESLAGLPSVPIVTVFQPNPPGSPGLDNAEFSLDLDMIVSMAPGLDDIIIYLPDGVVTDEEMFQQMAYPTNGLPRPNQISSSWAIDTSPASTNYLRELVVQGQAFFKYSGDSGAWVTGTNNYPGFNYLTIVGGTDLYLTNNGEGWQTETVWGGSGPTGGGSGSSGGVLGGIPMPFYQVGTDVTRAGGSSSHRNCPDVAAAASGIEIVDSFQPTNGSRQTGQVLTGVGGTSAATPLWAAFAALVNEQAADDGKPPIGFVNPAIYTIGNSVNYSSKFHDITSGNTTWSNSPTKYYATNGFDLCTGWGSPAGSSTINALLGLTGPIFVDFNATGTPDGSFDHPYKTLAQGTTAVQPSGTIFIIHGGSSSETMTISKPMTITAQDGEATVGN